MHTNVFAVNVCELYLRDRLRSMLKSWKVQEIPDSIIKFQIYL